VGHGGKETLALRVEDLLARQAMVSTEQGAKFARPVSSPIAIALLLLHREEIIQA
jgi:hypothetical protein